ncbi:MAG: hypothetical protein NT138_01635 [Planctomycetales bacterium]|nr:hypothetical protein [Planctomycetales bacterium]
MRHETTLEESSHFGESIGGSSVGGNPYEIPASFSQVVETPSNTVPRGVLMRAAMSCIAGTAVSGAIFGTFLFPIIGTVFGFILALLSSIPVSVFVLNVVRLAHGRTIRKSTVVGLAAFCGGLSGFLSVALLSGFRADSLLFGAMAACFGMPGGALATWMYLRTKTDTDTIRYTPPDWADLDSATASSVDSRY